MYTGIIQQHCPISTIEEKDHLRRFAIALSEDLRKGLELGASVAVSGVCLTVAGQDEQTVYFDVMKETLDKTTLGLLQTGDLVNIERSAKAGDEIGGHIMAGHVFGMATIIAREQQGDTLMMRFEVPKEWMKYIMEKGFIALDGASLTLSDVDKQEGKFSIYFIPETLRLTTFGNKQVGDKVNVEIDHHTQTIVETVERVLQENSAM